MLFGVVSAFSCAAPSQFVATSRNRADVAPSFRSFVEPIGLWCGESVNFTITVVNSDESRLPIDVVPADPYAWGGWFSVSSRDLLPSEHSVGTLRVKDSCETDPSDYCRGDTVTAALAPRSSTRFVTTIDGFRLREGRASIRVSYSLARGAPVLHDSLFVRLLSTPSRMRCFFVQLDDVADGRNE
jgi:hypothetical protein